MDRPTHRRTLIVGAGLAGLGAALNLARRRDDDFLVLEAAASAGGRARTVRVDGRALDLGAQWIHGSDNALYRFALERDLLASETSREGRGAFVRSGGRVADERAARDVAQQVADILEECATPPVADGVATPASLGHVLERRFRERLDASGDDDDARAVKLELFDWHVRFQVVDNSCRDLHELSARWWGAYDAEAAATHYNLRDGFASLVDALVGDLPAGRVAFDAAVRRIDYSRAPPIVVESDAGTFTCDHLILTPSVGVLERMDVAPPLPATPGVGFHGIGKVFLFFDERWWGDFGGFQFLWGRDDDDVGWVRHLTGFEEVFNHPLALLGWIGGEGLRAMEELDEREVANACVATLRRFLGGLLDVPQCRRIIRTRWLSDPLTRGSYCHVTTDSDSAASSPIEARSRPILVRGVPRVLLAGEASHPTRYSTAHGAFESGVAQSDVLCEYLDGRGK